jgi:hypothetical protein
LMTRPNTTCLLSSQSAAAAAAAEGKRTQRKFS